MSSNRTERLLNLVIALASTRRWLTKEQIRHAVPQYTDCDSSAAFDRMFERDKEDLRELGVPLVTGAAPGWDEDLGYRIDRGAYALPAVNFTPEELAVLSLASRVWQQASLAGPAARAVVKLRALGVVTDTESLVGVEPRVRTTEPAFDALYAATRDRAPVSFDYLKPDQTEVTERLVEPWLLTSRGGWWYLIGRDRDRGEPRVFKLSRVQGRIRQIGPVGSVVAPPDLDAASMITRAGAGHDERTAVIAVRAGRGAALRLREGAKVSALSHDQQSQEWERLTFAVGDLGQLAEQLAGYGPDAVVLAPEDLRRAVLDRLTNALRVHQSQTDHSIEKSATSIEKPDR